MSDSTGSAALQVAELEIESRVAKLGTRVTFVSPDMLAGSGYETDVPAAEDLRELDSRAS